jgi:hypothetical protein
MQKGTLSSLFTLVSDAIFKIKIMEQVQTLKNLLQDLRKLRKKLPMVCVLLGLLIAAVVSCWSFLMVMGVFELHALLITWLHALMIMFTVNIIAILFFVLLLSILLNKMKLSKGVKSV